MVKIANYLSLSEGRVATSLRASSLITASEASRKGTRSALACLLAISVIGELARRLSLVQQCFNSKVTPPRFIMEDT